ncbi:hypothetical protein PCASD_21573 [Puccinia coronata f. sp. avenae]|uniref:Uncharacterized protein n=1 Tax=Puccinia coronata f. sp. avenae TaxID=200324 RepID=A0A2N5UHB5_9BASI|nr:hypothetical protein PCASD_21573 [Puccinia coronata f. sp. avenae]
MTVVRNLNHPMLVNGLFQPLAHSSSLAPQNNMYGNLKKPSYFQCGGLAGTKENYFEVQLSTTTALNNKLEDSSTYSLNGQMIAMSDGTTPVLTYIDTSVVRVLDSSAPLPDMVNKTNVTGLGHVSHCAEVISTEPERSLRLEVTVAHNNWDPIVSYVSVTCSYKTARSMSAGGLAATLSPKTGRNFVKFGNQAESAKPTDAVPPKPFKAAQAKLASTSSKDKGKAKLVKPETEDESLSSDDEDKEPEDVAVPVTPVTFKRGRPRKDDLVAAAKKMKQM